MSMLIKEVSDSDDQLEKLPLLPADGVTFPSPYSSSSDEKFSTPKALLPWYHPLREVLKYIILLCVSMTIIGGYYSYDTVGIVATELMEDLHISQADFALLYSVYSIPNMFLPLVGGWFLDRFGIRLGFSIYVSLVAVGTGIVAIAPFTSIPYEIMLIGRFIFGIGAESTYVAHYTFCYIWFKNKRLALAMATIGAVARASEIFTFNTGPLISDSYGGYDAYLIFAFLVSLVSALFGYCAVAIDWWAEKTLKKEGIYRKSLERSSFSVISHFSQIRKFPASYWMLVLVLLSFFSTIYPLISFASDFLQIKWDYSEEYAGQIASLLSLTSMVMSPICGYVLDRIGKRIYAVNLGNLLLIPACLLLGYTYAPPEISIVVVGAAYSIVPAAIWPSLALLIDEKSFSTSYGLSTSIANSGLVFIYWLVGEFVDASSSIDDSCLLLAFVSLFGVISGLIWQYFDHRDGSVCNRKPASS